MATSSFNLFEEAPQQNSKWQGAPKLQPKGGVSTLINIHGDYRWTISPQAARSEIPVIEFEEFQLDLSSLITSALYKIRGGIENAQAFGQNVDDTLKKITNELNKVQIKDFNGALPTATSEELNPYAGMYAATPTGFRYAAPYLEPLNQNVNNAWGDDQSNIFNSEAGKILQNAGVIASNLINTTNLANITAPGSYAETPKFFNPGQADTYTIRFPLLNTYDANDIAKNWELCYLLTYQNLANRRSVNLLDPPVLYRVTIPGIRQSPIAYISNLSILHVGNIRNMDINGLIKPVPEAYMVQITFQDLLLNSRNIFKYALDGQRVQATVVPSNLRTTLTGTPVSTPSVPRIPNPTN